MAVYSEKRDARLNWHDGEVKRFAAKPIRPVSPGVGVSAHTYAEPADRG
jgi:DUF971 family protein